MDKTEYEKTVALYDELVDKCKGIERKGKTSPYTSSNGYMFSFINKAGEFGIRFSKEEQEKLIKKLDTTIFKSHGAVMKGYVLIPKKMFEDLNDLAKYLRKSHKHVNSLPPK